MMNAFNHLNGNRSKVKSVLEGIQAAADAGIKVKVNMVVQKGKNDQDIHSDGNIF